MLPTTTALAEPLPLTMPIDSDPSTAACGTICRELPASRCMTWIIALCAPNPFATAASSRKAAIRVSAIWP